MAQIKIWLFTFLVATATAEDWPKFGGPNGNFVANEKNLKVNWQITEPKILWKHKIGLGFSSIVEAKGKAYSQGYSDGKNTIFCFDTDSGKLVWQKSYPCTLGNNYFKGGSRATPTIFEGKLYLLSHNGDFYCMDANDGSVQWSLSVTRDLKGVRPTWGFAGSPLIYGKSIILNIGAEGSSLVCLNPANGKIIWKTGTYDAAYASINKRNNVEEFFLFHADGLSVHRMNDGYEKLFYQHKTRYGINASQPVEIGDKVLLSSAYGKGTALVDFSSSKPKALWKTEKISSQMSTPIVHGGYLYGIHGQAGARSRFSTLFCLDVKNGKVIWEKKGFGLGTLILVNNTLIVMSDQGEVVFTNASSSGYKELSRFQILGGKDNWIPPSYANGRLHCRSSDGDWVCLSLLDN